MLFPLFIKYIILFFCINSMKMYHVSSDYTKVHDTHHNFLFLHFCRYPLFFLRVCMFFYLYVRIFWSFEVFLSLTIQHTELYHNKKNKHLLLFCPLSKMTKTFPIMDISASKNTISKFTQPLLDNKMWLVFISSNVFLVE